MLFLVENKCSREILTTPNAVQIVEKFRRMNDALGSSVKVAYNSEDLFQFLDKTIELRKYKWDMANADNDSSYDSE
jgi:hypothetical protein